MAWVWVYLMRSRNTIMDNERIITQHEYNLHQACLFHKNYGVQDICLVTTIHAFIQPPRLRSHHLAQGNMHVVAASASGICSVYMVLMLRCTLCTSVCVAMQELHRVRIVSPTSQKSVRSYPCALVSSQTDNVILSHENHVTYKHAHRTCCLDCPYRCGTYPSTIRVPK